MRNVSAIDRFFGGEVVVVADAGWTGVGPAVVAFDVVDELRERIGSKHAEARMEAMRVGHLKSVIVGVTNGRGLVLDTAVMRERTQKLLTRDWRVLQLATAGRDLSVERVGDQLVEGGSSKRKVLRIEHISLVPTCGEFDAAVAYVSDVNHVVVANGILYAEHPLLEIGGGSGASNSRYTL